MTQKPKSPEDYIFLNPQWEQELILLRHLLLETEMEESIKWNFPCYTLNKKNVASLGATKSYVGIWFFQGVFLEDAAHKLHNAQERKTKAMRQWRFGSLAEIEADLDLLRAYLFEAMENQRLSKEMKPERKSKPLVIPPELAAFLEKNPLHKERFEATKLTYQREFADYIAEAKRAATKERRLEKIAPMILDMKSINDKYRK